MKNIRQLLKKDKSGVSQLKPSVEYQKWRDLIFSVESEQVGVASSQPNQVYGAMMEVGLANRDGSATANYFVISVTAFASGESSLNTSVGGGVIGLGNKEEIADLAKQIVHSAQIVVDQTKPSNKRALPESGRVYFYFLTTTGIRLGEGSLKEVYAKMHPFNEIFSLFSIIKRQADEYRDNMLKRK